MTISILRFYRDWGRFSGSEQRESCFWAMCVGIGLLFWKTEEDSSPLFDFFLSINRVTTSVIPVLVTRLIDFFVHFSIFADFLRLIDFFVHLVRF